MRTVSFREGITFQRQQCTPPFFWNRGNMAPYIISATLVFGVLFKVPPSLNCSNFTVIQTKIRKFRPALVHLSFVKFQKSMGFLWNLKLRLNCDVDFPPALWMFPKPHHQTTLGSRASKVRCWNEAPEKGPANKVGARLVMTMVVVVMMMMMMFFLSWSECLVIVFFCQM